MHRRKHPIADSSDRLDVAGAKGVVSEFLAQAREVARERVVSHLKRGSAQRRGKLAIRDHGTRLRDKRVQENVLVWGQPHLSRTLLDRSVQSVNLKIGNPKRSDRIGGLRLRSHAISVGPLEISRMTTAS